MNEHTQTINGVGHVPSGVMFMPSSFSSVLMMPMTMPMTMHSQGSIQWGGGGGGGGGGGKLLP